MATPRCGRLDHAPRLVARGAALLTHADQASFGFRSVAFLLAHSHAHKVAAYLFTVLVIEPTKPLACDPASLPKLPLSKEYNAKLRGKEAIRQNTTAIGGKGSMFIKPGRNKPSKAAPAQDAIGGGAHRRAPACHPHSSLSLYPLSPLSSALTLPIHALLKAVAVDVDPPRVVLVFGGGPIRVGAELLDAVPSLRCIITISAGINHIDLRECACRGVQVVNAGGVYSTDVADYAVGPVRRARRGMRADSRDTAHLDRGRASTFFPYVVHQMMMLFLFWGCLSFVDFFFDRHRPRRELQRARRGVRADGGDAAHRGLGRAGHAVGVVVNVVCGANIDEAELVRALAEGRVAGVGLEVFEDEPNVPPELRAMDNVVLRRLAAPPRPSPALPAATRPAPSAGERKGIERRGKREDRQREGGVRMTGGAHVGPTIFLLLFCAWK
ncbi:glyoxylate/hydroxypyruvate reductase A HPR2 [Oryza sativa Japonica Group]|uniref:glyoxylate/hydroxypyruvate reductase A HPR2 n=1 Tax=Oryza sativa subsp. japonica TaxID=39947 RepID=UPI00339BF8EE